MKELGIERLEEFADHIGMGRATLYALVRGRVSQVGTPIKPSFDTLVLLAKGLDRPLHQLVYMLDPDAPGADEIPRDLPIMQPVPIKTAGWIGAGPDEYEEIDGEHIWVEERFARGKDLVAFRIRGDSMEGGPRPIFDGDLVLVNKKDKGFDGATVVARLDGGGYVCKLLKDDRFGKHLVSQNPNYTNGTPPYIPADQVEEIVGRVIEVRHSEIGAGNAVG
jgi:repressor LexA